MNNREELQKTLKALEANPDDASSIGETVELLCKLTHEFSRSDPDLAEHYVSRALVLSEKFELKQGIADSLLTQGTLNWVKGDFKKALESYLKSLKICKETGYSRGAANCHSNVGIIRKIQGNYEEALNSHFKSLKIKEEINDYAGIAKSYNNIGIIYDERGQCDDALDYYRKALKMFTKIDDQLGIAITYNNIGIIYESKNDYTHALEYYNHSLKIKEKIGDIKGIAGATLNIASLFVLQKKYKNALEYSRKALHSYTHLGDKRGIADSSNWTGRILTKLKNFNAAFPHLNKGLQLAIETGAKQRESDSYQYLLELHQAQGDFEQALIYSIKFSKLREKIFNSESIEKIAQMQVKYETEKKEEEAEIYRSIFENTLVGMYRISPDGSILMVNSTLVQMLGYSSSEELKKHNFLDTGSDTEHPLFEFHNHFINNEITQGLETVWFNRDGSPLHFLENYRVVRDESGKLLYFEGTVEDITERKKLETAKLKLEREVLQTQKLESLGVLTGGIAHDFNNILMAILGNADLALIEIDQGSKAHSNVKAIEESAKRAAGLVKQMLAYTGKGKLLVEWIDISNIIQEMKHILEVSISRKTKIRFHLAENLPLIEGDAAQIRQTIINLVANASDAIESADGSISLTTGTMICDSDYLGKTYFEEPLSEGHYVFIDVTDNGCGMTEQTRNNLFDPFYTTKFTGRGLGLAAVSGIIRGHFGAVNVRSEPGNGTTIRVLFPAQRKHGKLKLEAFSGKSNDLSGSGAILLVDDEESVLSVGKQMLEHLGFSVVTASDGQAAVDLYKEHSESIMLVILDLIMPVLDGEETFKKLCEINEDVAVILCSGYNEQEVTQRFIGKELAGFLQKPYRFSQLEAIINKVISN